MIQPLAPQPTDTPDYANILRQGDLEDRLAEILQAAFDADNFTITTDNLGREYGLTVDDTSGGTIRATLYRDAYAVEPVEVAQVRLDYTVVQS